MAQGCAYLERIISVSENSNLLPLLSSGCSIRLTKLKNKPELRGLGRLRALN